MRTGASNLNGPSMTLGKSYKLIMLLHPALKGHSRSIKHLESVAKVLDAMRISLHAYNGHRDRATEMANSIHKVLETREPI